MLVSGIQRRMAITMVLAAIGVTSSGCIVKTTTSTTDTATTQADPSQTGAAGSNAAASDAEASTISAEGSSTVYPICQAFAVEFEKKSKHKVSVGRQGTGGGYKKFVNRQADIWNASRLITPKEIDELKEKGIEWLQLHVAVDGIVIAVNPQNNWCSNLTCAQLKQLWEPDSKVKTWNELDSSWPAEQIQLYGADTDSGTFEYFTEEINGKKGATNTKYSPSSDDNVLVQGIAGNKGALGYIPFGYFIENTDKLKAVAISATKDASVATPAPFVEPSVDSILSGEYIPLSRPLFMYVNKASLKRPEVGDFLKFAMSTDSQHLVEKRGFVPSRDSVREKSMNELEAALSEQSSAK